MIELDTHGNVFV